MAKTAITVSTKSVMEALASAVDKISIERPEVRGLYAETAGFSINIFEADENGKPIGAPLGSVSIDNQD